MSTDPNNRPQFPIEVHLDAEDVARAMAHAILKAQERPVSLGVTLDGLEKDLQRSFKLALDRLQFEPIALNIETGPLLEAIREAVPNANGTTLDPEALESAVAQALTQVENGRRWNHQVIRTEEPPNEKMLDTAGLQGYELVNIVHDGERSQWITYLKKLVV